jgi:hypothetical protein
MLKTVRKLRVELKAVWYAPPRMGIHSSSEEEVYQIAFKQGRLAVLEGIF